MGSSMLCRITIVIVWVTAVCTAQIPMRSVGNDRLSAGKTTYDSTANFLGEQVGGYVGQTLYLKGVSLRMRGFGYSSFTTRVPQGAGDMRAIYKRGAPLNRFNSPYESLALRYFTVVEIVRSGKGTVPTYPRERVFLKLVDKANSEVLYFEYDPRNEALFPFVVQGYFEKVRANWIGRRFLVRRLDGICGPELANTSVKPGDTVTCAGFFIEDRTFSIVGSYKRTDGAELFVSLNRISDIAYLLELDSAATVRVEIGEEAFTDVLRGIIKPGMTPRMCEVAWGKPKNVNRIVHHHGTMEQWVYADGKAVYFENNVVSSIQEEPGVHAAP